MTGATLCTSVNEVVCHGIPDTRPLEFGDVISLDVSCYLNGVHGDNCATVIAGDYQDTEGSAGRDWRGVPYKMDIDDPLEEMRIQASRRLVQGARDALYHAIDACRPGGCLSQVGAAVHEVADAYGYDTVQKYRGHGISHEFHCPPFVKVCLIHLLFKAVGLTDLTTYMSRALYILISIHSTIATRIESSSCPV